MIIYPFPAKELDDKMLNKQIKAIAQTLCNAHWLHFARLCSPDIAVFEKLEKTLPLTADKNLQSPYCYWAQECRANYLKLVDMGIECCREHCYRFIRMDQICSTNYPFENKALMLKALHKLQPVIIWARDNIPDLPEKTDCVGLPVIDTDPDYCLTTPFPLAIPEKYKRADVSAFDSQHRIEGLNELDEVTFYCYRNYYRAKLSTKAKWTRRNKPEWLI